MLSFEQSSLRPLTTDALIHERAAHLVGRAVNRQLWVMFLDSDDYQLPILMPCEDLPESPPPWPLPLDEFLDAAGAQSLFVVLERYGPESLTESDRAWAKHIHDSCAAASVPLRAILLSHRRGVRWVAAEDYLFS